VGIISNIANAVEASQERFANMNKIIEIQSKLRYKKSSGQPAPLLQPSRLFVYEGVVDVVLQDTDPPREIVPKAKKLFLFNDLLIISHISTEKLAKKAKLEVFKCEHLISISDIVDIFRNSGKYFIDFSIFFKTNLQRNL
jgi:hypothetical protein